MGFKFPWFPLASAAAAALGLFGLYWWENLSAEDKARADALCVEYAQRLYGCTVGELTADQRARVHGLVKADLAN